MSGHSRLGCRHARAGIPRPESGTAREPHIGRGQLSARPGAPAGAGGASAGDAGGGSATPTRKPIPTYAFYWAGLPCR
jgi:hypothetical protein